MSLKNARTHERSQQGYTLVELMTTLVLLSLFFAMTVPSLKRLFQHYELDASARQFVSAVRGSQIGAWSHGEVQELWLYRFKPQYQRLVNGQNAGVVKLPDALQYRNGYLEAGSSVFRFDQNGTLTGSGQVRLVNKLREGADVNILMLSGTVTYEGVHP